MCLEDVFSPLYPLQRVSILDSKAELSLRESHITDGSRRYDLVFRTTLPLGFVLQRFFLFASRLGCRPQRGAAPPLFVRPGVMANRGTFLESSRLRRHGLPDFAFESFGGSFFEPLFDHTQILNKVKQAEGNNKASMI